MSKSLTSAHISLLSEREEIDAKIREIETHLGKGIVVLIKNNNGFRFHYSLLCGALIETLQTLDSNKEKHSDWQHQGEKFLRALQPTPLSKAQKKNIHNT